MGRITRSRILAYGCTLDACSSPDHLWQNLIQKKKVIQKSFAHIGKQEGNHSKEFLTSNLLKAWNQARAEMEKNKVPLSKNFGVILASTKGCVEDFIWDAPSSASSRDPLTPVLENFLLRAELSGAHAPQVSLCVSNACTSSLSALYLGDKWIKQGRVDQVVILAADQIGPFVSQGFQSLQALSQTFPKPFSADRDGLALGEAAAVIVMGSESVPAHEKVGFQLSGVALDTEGYAVTRPSPSGESLKRAYLKLKSTRTPDLIIAHGTGTLLNDSAEDQTYTELFAGKNIPITGTKWCIGHTLGASGAMDIIAACEVLKRQEAFTLGSTSAADSKFKGHYLTADHKLENFAPQTVLVSSLGFGGVQGIAEVSL